MKIRFEWLFMGAVGVVAVCILIAWATATNELDMDIAERFVPAAAMEIPAAPVATAVTADAQQVAVADAQAAAAPPAEGLPVPMIATEAERGETLEQRKSALPQFLAVADESIARLQSDIELAKARSTDASEVAAMEARLRNMQRAREQVLARNDDIRN